MSELLEMMKRDWDRLAVDFYKLDEKEQMEFMMYQLTTGLRTKSGQGRPPI